MIPFSGRIRAEQRLEEAIRENSLLRRQLQDEKEHIREVTADLERKTKTAMDKAAEEMAEVDRLQKRIEGFT